MQRTLVILVVILLVTASLGVGALAANWPFWRRASAWHAAEGGWPPALPGPHVIVRGGGGTPLRFAAALPDLAAAAGLATTEALLRVRGAQADAWFAAGFDADTPVDGRGLSPVLLLGLFAELERRHAGLHDRAIGAWLDAWRQDHRGATTPRELLASLAGGIASPPAASPLNPFSARARLASGPDFERAALATYAPGNGARQAAAAQLLARVAAAVEQRDFQHVVQDALWSRVAAGDARLPLDRRRGGAAAHCCLQASAADWIRLGLHVGAAQPQSAAMQQFATPGRAMVLAADGAVLWVGSGPPPSGLEILLQSPTSAGGLTAVP